MSSLNAPSRKTFTIEKMGSPGDDAAPDEAASAPPLGLRALGIHDVLSKLDHLTSMLAPTQVIVSNIAEAYRREVTEVLKLRQEMEDIRGAIESTKREVVSLHAGSSHSVKVNHATGELGAVVLDTEGATNNILAAAERIEMLAGVIQSETTMGGMKTRAGDIGAVVLSIYEACNFQDLTGQRITRVCDTLNFVESRVARMADIWGGLDSLSNIMVTEMEALRVEQAALGTHALANGPALVGAVNVVNQDDIDALFD